jgi:hypothetical protein
MLLGYRKLAFYSVEIKLEIGIFIIEYFLALLGFLYTTFFNI